MQLSELSYSAYFMVEIVWLTPFFLVATMLVYAQARAGTEQRLDARLKAANVFLLTALAARSTALMFKNNAGRPLPHIETLTLALLPVFLIGFYLTAVFISAKLFRVNEALILKGLIYLPVLVLVLFFTVSALAVAGQLMGGGGLEWSKQSAGTLKKLPLDFNIRRREVLSFSPRETGVRPLTAKELRRAKDGLINFVPEKPVVRQKAKMIPEKIPRVVENPGITATDLLPKAEAGLLVLGIEPEGRNTLRATVLAHGGPDNGAGRLFIAELSTSAEARRFFGREPGWPETEIEGQKVVVIYNASEALARWTISRFAFEAGVARPTNGPAQAAADLLKRIVQISIRTAKTKIR